MLLASHIIIALSGLVLAALTFFSPSILKLRILAGTTTYTLASGTVLMFTLHASITRTCLSGLAYLGVVLTSMAFSYKKLVSSRVDSRIN